jgi:hypothetical protein
MTYGTQRFRMEDLLLEASGSPYNREILLYSDMADAEISGAFRLAAMPDEISDVLNTFLPSLQESILRKHLWILMRISIFPQTSKTSAYSKNCFFLN